jgi:superfamily I DNA and/or RNA helicase
MEGNIENFKIVVATMTSVDSFVRKRVADDHFDFIFIDECCAATEPECLIPIVNFGMSKGKVNANVILIGDDKLLGPVLHSQFAVGLGLGTLMEYLKSF